MQWFHWGSFLQGTWGIYLSRGAGMGPKSLIVLFIFVPIALSTGWLVLLNYSGGGGALTQKCKCTLIFSHNTITAIQKCWFFMLVDCYKVQGAMSYGCDAGATLFTLILPSHTLDLTSHWFFPCLIVVRVSPWYIFIFWLHTIWKQTPHYTLIFPLVDCCDARQCDGDHAKILETAFSHHIDFCHWLIVARVSPWLIFILAVQIIYWHTIWKQPPHMTLFFLWLIVAR